MKKAHEGYLFTGCPRIRKSVLLSFLSANPYGGLNHVLNLIQDLRIFKFKGFQVIS